MLKTGIVGLPNVGKSTLFNAVTRTRKAQAANFPFCTIEPNVGIVNVPDDRLQKLAAISKSEKILPAAIEFVDIAGLVAGASEGEGLGNQFLSHIREVDAIIQVVRCFESSDIHHVSGTVDPVRDIEVINTELALADLATVEGPRTAARKALDVFGTIDILVNNAGVTTIKSIIDTPVDDWEWVNNVNLRAPYLLAQALVPKMIEQRMGKVINISSMGGKMYTPLGSWYHATKHAVEGWSDSLRLELFGEQANLGGFNAAFRPFERNEIAAHG